MRALSELTCLTLHRPGADAGVVADAAFLERMAGVHERLAAESAGAEAAAEWRRAAACHQRAFSLINHTQPEGIPS